MAQDFEPVRLGLIGCGGMGRRHAMAILEMQANGCRAVEIAAICDTDPARRQRLAEMVEAGQGRRPRECAEIAQLLDDPRVEAVDVVLPTSLHHDAALAALAAGRDVLLEKPLALTVAACDLIVAAAERAGKVAAVAENYRRLPGNRALGALIREGAFGRLDAMCVRNFAPVEQPAAPGQPTSTAPRWYFERTLAGGYHALEMGVHEADLQEYWFGPIVSVSASMSAFGDPRGAKSNVTEDMLGATLRFACGFVSQIAFASTMPGFSSADRLLFGPEIVVSSSDWHEWQKGFVVGAGGSRRTSEAVVAEWMARLSPEERIRMFPDGAWKSRPDGSVAADPLSYGVGIALYDFARAIRTGAQPEIPVAQARKAVAVCCAMMESARSGRVVQIEQVLSGEIAQAQAELNHAIGVPA